MTETPLPVAFDPATLDTLGRFNFSDQLKGQTTTAHPHYDPQTGEGFNFLTYFGPQCVYNIFKYSATAASNRELIASVPTNNPSYMHSFALTKNYIVLTEIPFRASMLGLFTRNIPFFHSFSWDVAAGTTFIVVDRKTGQVAAKLQAESFFTFHHINAYEDDVNIVIDLVRYDDPSFVTDWTDTLSRKELKDFSFRKSYAHRFTLDLVNKKVLSRRLSNQIIELPRINYDERNMQPYSYVYGVGASDDCSQYQLIKLNVSTGHCLVWEQEGCYPGEPIFVAAPTAVAEDDGVVISTVLDSKSRQSFVLVLDAQTFKEIGRATVSHHIPFALHGMFCSQ